MRRIYRHLLLAFPLPFRRRFGDDMAAVFGDRLRAARERGAAAVVTFWWRTVVDTVRHGFAERRAARRAAAGRSSMLGSVLQDLRFALRTLRQQPGLTATAIATLAIGIGAATAVFSVADALVIRSLPYPAADRLVALTDDNAERGDSVNVALPNFDDWRASVDAIDAAAAWQTADVNLVGAAAERVSGAVVAGDFFEIVGATPVVGRTFGPDEPNAHVAVVSERAWRNLFGGRRDVAGSTAVLDGLAFEIIGVVSEIPGLADVDVWRPVQRAGAAIRRTSHGYRAVARLAPGVTLEQARGQFDVVAGRLAATYPESNAGWTVGVTPLRETQDGEFGQLLTLVSAVAGVLLLIACTNVAGLLVARAVDRRREFVVRVALGAPRRRIVRQLLTESVLLSAAGAAGGVLVATWAIGLIVGLLPSDATLWRTPAMSGSALAFATTLAVATGLVFGLAPALSTTRDTAAHQSLRDLSSFTSVRARRLRGGLVFVQITLSSMLLVGAGLLGVSLWRALQIDSGLDAGSTITFQVTPARSTHADAVALRQYYDDLIGRLAARPEVQVVGATSSLPMADNDAISTVRRPDEPAPARGDERWALHQISTPGYLRASGTRLIAGRDFTPEDTGGSEPVVIVNDTLARELWPGESPVGQTVLLEPDTAHRVVGVIADVRHFGLDQQLYRQYFVPLAQAPARTMGVVARLRSPLREDALRSVVAEADGSVAPYNLRSLAGLASDSLRSRRGLAGTVAACGLAAVLLAAIGLFGIVATGVRDRRREIGIRVTLGASHRSVVALFVRRAAGLAGAAIIAGLVASYWATGLVEQFLFEVEALDPFTLATAALALFGISVLAAWLPAARAAQVDPARTLRSE